MLRKRKLGYWPIAATLVALAGCQGEPAAPPKQPSSAAAESPASVALRVLVVNDTALAEAIGRLRGEWHEQSGGELLAESKPWPEILAADKLDADVIVFPTRYMGELCVRGWLRPVRKSVLEDKSLDFDDIFPLVRQRLIVWGGQTMALPLGIDFLSSSSWTDARAVEFLDEIKSIVVLPDRSGDLFDPESMKPRIADRKVVAALRQDARDTTHSQGMPVLGMGDRMASVSASSRNAASAFKLLAWLANADVSSELTRECCGTAPVRKSLVSAAAWYEPRLSEDERRIASRLLEAGLNRDDCLIVPRIPGIDEYMDALAEAVKQIAVDKSVPIVALQQAADKWEQITDAHGREAQRQAYLKHLGISE